VKNLGFRLLDGAGDGDASYILEGIIDVKLQDPSANLRGKPLIHGLDDGSVIRLKRIYNFWCPCLVYTNCFVFCLHFVAFYAFFRTNLLMRCHSGSSLFSAVFVFQKSYTGNILGIGRNEARSSYFPPTRDGVQKRLGGGLEGNHTRWWRGWTPGHATLGCGALAAL
jgi:hypothetical protein